MIADTTPVGNTPKPTIVVEGEESRKKKKKKIGKRFDVLFFFKPNSLT